MKRLSSTLKLNKSTIANLSIFELDKAKGGLRDLSITDIPITDAPISKFGCQETLDSHCVKSYCCFTDPYAQTEISCDVIWCAL